MAPSNRSVEILLHLPLNPFQPFACPLCHPIYIPRHLLQPLHVSQENRRTPPSRVADFGASNSSSTTTTSSSSSSSSSSGSSSGGPVFDVAREGLVGTDEEEEEGGEGAEEVGEEGGGGWLAFEAPDGPCEGDVGVVGQDGVHAQDEEGQLREVGNGSDEVGGGGGEVDCEHGREVHAGTRGEEAGFDGEGEVDAQVFFPGDELAFGVAEALFCGGDPVEDPPVVHGQGDE